MGVISFCLLTITISFVIAIVIALVLDINHSKGEKSKDELINRLIATNNELVATKQQLSKQIIFKDGVIAELTDKLKNQ